MSERTEETSLLPEDEARRMPLDDIVMVVDAQMPIRAKRIQYYDDPFFKAIHGAQKGELPFPARTLKAVEPVIAEEPEDEEQPALASAPQEAAENLSVKEASDQPHRAKLKTSKRKRSKAVAQATQATRDMDERQREFDLSVQQRLDLPEPGDVSDADVQALRDADAKLAEFEASFTEGQGGERATAAE